MSNLSSHSKTYLVQILWMGKPDPVIYDVALDMLQLPKESVLAIGDSLQHDIQGDSCATPGHPYIADFRSSCIFGPYCISLRNSRIVPAIIAQFVVLQVPTMLG